VTRVLVVEDDEALGRALVINLKVHGYDAQAVRTGAAALAAAASGRPDLVVLDLGLPDLDGSEVLSGLRGYSSVPVIILSARSSGGDKVNALDLGADDYVTKPFAMDELLARVRAALRRAASAGPGAAMVHTGAFDVDLAAKQVVRDGTPIHLTPTEWGILEVLARHVGKLVEGKQLLSEVWGPEYAGEGHYLRVYVAQLRRKLEPEPAQPRHILTAPGVGYRLIP
jgi:two-component system KDP operon response regulator KdpE